VTVVVDYDAGNLRSVETALAYLGESHTVSSDPADIRSASRVIFPGVGDGAHAMGVLRERALDSAIVDATRGGIPVLGICVGCQVVFDRTEEHDARCLGLVPGTARAFPASGQLKVPHMGWNTIEFEQGHWLFRGIAQNASFYFVHSYYPNPSSEDDVIAWADYGIRFAAAVERGSLVAVQFHPEKSGETGLQVLRNFLGHTAVPGSR
jgi:glutamine amidotransferase